jgi:ferredoxin
MKRKIITIDEEKCTGCGLCIPDCPEGALQILDKKARLVSDLFCDGLGACIGTCPEGAISVIEREAEPYDERAVMETIIRQGEAVIKAHLIHLRTHGETGLYSQAVAYLQEKRIPNPDSGNDTGGVDCGNHAHHQFGACPGAGPRIIERKSSGGGEDPVESPDSDLRQWPVQLRLINPGHPSLEGAELLISADCVPFAYRRFHRDFLQGKTLIIFCPKLDQDLDEYIDKLATIFSRHSIRSITVVHMEVPCCSGVRYIVDKALEKAGKGIPVSEATISVEGKLVKG